MALLQNPKRLARLLSSIQVSHSDRPLGPIETAEAIQEVLEELGNDTQELQSRLSLSSSMISAFARVLTLPENIKGIVSWGGSNHDMSRDGEISFSAAQQLARLKSTNDILRLVGTTLKMSRPVTKEEIKAIVALRRENPQKDIDDCIREVLDVTRTYVVQHFVFISGIDPRLVVRLKAMAHKDGRELDELALGVLSGNFPRDSIKGIKVRDDHVRVSMSEEGHKFIKSYAESHDLSKRSVLDHILSREIGNEP